MAAWFAVTSLMRTIELEFLPPNPHVVLDDTNAAEALHGRLREFLHFLEKSENQFNAEDFPMQDLKAVFKDVVVRQWKGKVEDVALRIEDEIESKVIDSYSGEHSRSTLAKSFHYTLEYAIEELTKSVREEYSEVKGILSSRERIESSSSSLHTASKLSSRERIESSSSSSLHTASKLQSTMVGRTAELEHDKYSLDKNWLDDLINLEKLEKLKLNSDHDDPIILPHASAFPVQLRMLTLKGTLVPWDVMEVVGMLPNLEVLKLKSGACKGQHWKLTGDWFPKLKLLLIQEMELMQWTAPDGAFPILERLIIKHCIHLGKIPSTFDELYSLQLIELYGCHSSLVRSAKRIKLQQEELLGNDWLVVHDYNTQVATTIEEKEQAKREEFEEQELEKVQF
nr:putative late blight resistance protein homolog R1A-10 [Ipomoea trifida]